MAIVHLQGVSVGFGGPPLLDRVDIQIERGERVCLVGRNGAGKSTLMRVIAGEVIADEGEVSCSQGARIARLEQEVPAGTHGAIYDVVGAGLGDLGRMLADYHHVSQRLAHEGGSALLERLERIQHELEAAGGWHVNQRVETVLSRLELDPDRSFDALSGGLKRRVLLARALVSEPDLLLLDEPTNHLDIEAITWLEEFLLGWTGTLLFVTHDRVFLEHLATRILELDRGRLTSWPGDYATYLRRKQAALEAEAGQQAEFDKKLAQEEAWIRQGIKARRTRNEGRVRALEALRAERRTRRERDGTVRLRAQQGELSGRQVVEAEAVGYTWSGTPIIRDLNTTILRGDKVGIIGPNGCGKTTLLRLLLGDLAPEAGHLRLGTRLQVAYFDQQRAQINPEMTVMDNVGGGSEKVMVDGRPRHIMSYLQDFLFSPEQARTPAKALSGGERNRLLLARLFTQPSNVLVLDEPTNDLDAETLELLEDLLVEYQGTVLLVSHDRAFLNGVVTSTLVFEGGGRVNEYVGGYDDWLRQRRPEPSPIGGAAPAPVKIAKSKPVPARPRKLSYKNQRELEALPDRIAALEQEQQDLHRTLADPDLYRREADIVAATTARLQALERELNTAYERWEELEGTGERSEE